MTDEIWSKIFKAYDIRGLYPEEINEAIIYKIGQAFAGFLKNTGKISSRQIIVGRDARLSSGDLADSLIQSLQNSEVDVLDIGQVSTPNFYWSIINQQADGGLMVTASHNPANFNGLKLCGQKAASISLETGLLEIKEIALLSQISSVSSFVGKVRQKNLLTDYINFTLGKFNKDSVGPLRLVVDCGNGMAGPEASLLLKKLPCQAEVLFSEPDGNFPNHEANPLKEENLTALKEKIKVAKADLGIAFDGDADRIILLDEKGQPVRGDFVTALLAIELLKENPGQKILYEVRSSRIVPELIKQNNGQSILGRAGHSLIKEQMRREDILFGGELSGHYFFKNLGFVENTLFVMLEILKIMSREKRPLSEIIAPFAKYWTSGEINFIVAAPDLKLREIEKKYQDARIKKIDGLTVEYADWWFNLRKSNTEPLVRLNIEADTPILLEEKKRELANFISGF